MSNLSFIYTTAESSKLPDYIENGKAVTIKKRKVTFSCNPGYFLSTKTNKFICNKNGNWNSNNLNPKCIKGDTNFDIFAQVFQCLLLFSYKSCVNLFLIAFLTTN